MRTTWPGPDVRLAYFASGAEAEHRPIATALRAHTTDRLPALLVSFVYLKPFLQHQRAYHYRDWSLDSGAFSVHASGVTVDLASYTALARRLLDEDATLREVFALDVIGDWRASRANTEAMWAAGVPAIPCFHYGEPWDVLVGLARDYPKIAIGGMVPVRGEGKYRFLEQCFARVWPKRIHGFGLGTAGSILRFPFHSVDATNWESGPCKFGQWARFGNLSVRGSSHNLTTQIRHYLELEERARVRWCATMQEVA